MAEEAGVLSKFGENIGHEASLESNNGCQTLRGIGTEGWKDFANILQWMVH